MQKASCCCSPHGKPPICRPLPPLPSYATDASQSVMVSRLDETPCLVAGTRSLLVPSPYPADTGDCKMAQVLCHSQPVKCSVIPRLPNAPCELKLSSARPEPCSWHLFGSLRVHTPHTVSMLETSCSSQHLARIDDGCCLQW